VILFIDRIPLWCSVLEFYLNLHEQLVLRLTLHEPSHTLSTINPYTCYTSEISTPRSCRDGSNPLVILIAICQCGNQFLIVGGTRTDQLLSVITTIVLRYTVHSSASRSNKHEFDHSTALRHTWKNHKQGVNGYHWTLCV
jgi:hypothetical protein